MKWLYRHCLISVTFKGLKADFFAPFSGMDDGTMGKGFFSSWLRKKEEKVTRQPEAVCQQRGKKELPLTHYECMKLIGS